MPGVNTIDSSVLAAVNGNAARQAAGTGEELNTNFLTLLITQLKNQDPLNPMENNELTSQLAQINTVSGIDELNKTLNTINSQIGAGQQLQAAGLIGHGVMVPGDQVLVGNDGVTTPFGLELAGPAASVSVSVRNQAGEIIRSFDLGAVDAGVQTLVWDGLLDSGETAPGGAYLIELDARNANGDEVPVEALRYALVNAVSVDESNQPLLDIGGIAEPVQLSEVRQIL